MDVSGVPGIVQSEEVEVVGDFSGGDGDLLFVPYGADVAGDVELN